METEARGILHRACAAGHSSSTLATASCRRPRPTTWPARGPCPQPLTGHFANHDAAPSPGRSGKQRVAVVLFNLGGPDSPDAIKPFLLNLFRDPAILRVPFFFRPLLARLIARARVKPATENYALLGGKSPLLDLTEKQAQRAGSRAAGHRGEVLHRDALLAPVEPRSRAGGARPGGRIRWFCCRSIRSSPPRRREAR